MKATIIGAGIGGLSVALALLREGIDVEIYEQAAVLREVGAGLAMSPNAVRLLDHLGLKLSLERIGVRSESFDYRDWRTGSLLGRIPLGNAAVERWGVAFYHVHRADLHSAVRDAVGESRLTLNAKCGKVSECPDGVKVHFTSGSAVNADVVIGADGIHSAVREYVAGPDRLVWSRQISWRGLAPAKLARDLGLETRHHSFWGPRKQFVAYYVSGGERINWVGNAQSDESWAEESWSARGSREEVLSLFHGWHPQVTGLIAGTDPVYKFALFEREPTSVWSRGRVTLLGDAAHPMLPFLAQGASQAIEDAVALARCLKSSLQDPVAAFRAYEAVRKERTAKVQIASRDAGRMMQLTDLAEVEARNSRLSASPEAPVSRFDWVWSHSETRIEPVSSFRSRSNLGRASRNSRTRRTP
jgi:salicylate hydroxylase